MNIGDWFSGIAAFAAVVSAIGTVFTAYIAYKALSTWKPQREAGYRDAFRLSLLDYRALVKGMPKYIDESKHSDLLEELSLAKLECDKNWDIATYKKSRRLSKYYDQLGVNHCFFMAFQINREELLDHCNQTLIRLDE
ncbi:hypothetical protein AB7X32_19990 [Morganella morganii]|uniref:hypothetical protein n=1 Tax=Morganella morganii TaxID=582 RepID=UPI0034E474BF